MASSTQQLILQLPKEYKECASVANNSYLNSSICCINAIRNAGLVECIQCGI